MDNTKAESYEMITLCYDVLENEPFNSLDFCNIMRNTLNFYIRVYKHLKGKRDLTKFLKYYV